MNGKCVFALVLLPVLLVEMSGCGILPQSGPSAGTMQASEAVDLVNVTPQQARDMAGQATAVREAGIRRSLDALTTSPAVDHFRFSPGDDFNLTLFSIPPCLPVGASTLGCPGIPSPIDIGHFTVSNEGDVILPYIGTMKLEGLDLESAQQQIAHKFASSGMFQSPAARIDLASSQHSGIIVTGSLGQPRRISWNPGGVTLVDAITQGLGNGFDILGSEGGESSARSAVNVSVFRGDAPAVTIPMQVALEHQIALSPGDRVIVTRRPTVRVVVLGGGVSKDGTFEYPGTPTLATVLAQASGLDTNVANNRAVFVLEPRGNDQKPLLYDFAWNQSAGLIASQVFPMKDGDLVYVDEALIVPIQKVVDTLFGVAAMANLAK